MTEFFKFMMSSGSNQAMFIVTLIITFGGIVEIINAIKKK